MDFSVELTFLIDKNVKLIFLFKLAQCEILSHTNGLPSLQSLD